MFARVKKSGPHQYVQVVHNERVEGRVRQRVIATLGRLDVLKESGQLDGLLAPLAKFSDHDAVLNALKSNQISPTGTTHIGPPLVFGKLWEQSGMPGILRRLLASRRFEFSTLIPIVNRLRERFEIRDVCVVADRGMISEKTISELTERNIRFILGARLRNVKEIRETVLSRGGRYHEVHGPREYSNSPSPLKVKQVLVDSRRYIVCHNEEQACKDRADREAILEKLRDQLKLGSTSLVGNKGFRKYLSAPQGGAFQIDQAKVERDARFDGKWVLRTDTDLPAEEVALRYKDLLMVENAFRTTKSILDTRPIFHKCDDTIRGHVFCSFLALVLLKDLQDRMNARGWTAEWRYLRDDLDELQELTLPLGEKTFVIRPPPTPSASRAIQSVGAALGPSVRQLN